MTTESGLTVTLVIPPNSLSGDTTITLTPNEDNPVDGITPPPDPGVTIGPPGTNFGPPATVTFTPSSAAGTLVPTGNTPSVSADPSAPGGFSVSPGRQGGRGRNTPSDSSSPFSDNAVIVFADDNGQVEAIPTSRTDDGSGIEGPVDGSGSTIPDDPDPQGAQNLASNAGAASGGACTGEYIEALARTIATASAAGDTAAISRYESEIRRCNDESADHLKYLCDHNPIQLRRKDFENRLALARALPASSGTASEVERLMNECQNKYRFRGEGTIPEAAAYGIMLLSSLDAEVCGFLDDEWMGTQTYEMSPEPNTAHTFEGKTKFRLPPNGGQFSGTSHGENSYVVTGRGVAIPDLDFGFTGNFDGNATIANLDIYPEVIIPSVPITLEDKSCVPLAPLPR